MKRHFRPGFTLIELLVVVAIIALLIAILLPSLGKAKMMAMRTRCGTVLKGWGTAVATYQAENSGLFSARVGSGIGAQWDQDPKAVGLTGNGLYSNQVTGGVIGQKMRFCPADSGDNRGNGAANYYLPSMSLPAYKFVWYVKASGGPIPGGTSPASSFTWKISQFKNTAEKLLMCDSNSLNNFGYFVSFIDGNDPGSGPKMLNGTAPGSPFPSTQFSSKDEIQARHRGVGSVLFLDGHVGQHPWADFVKNLPATSNDTDLTKNWTRLSQ
jgi:prepilin-type N-terminal cleavage/methylation domain-containing protein/prepilin-type processing-associated H-X9-DG protein